MIDYVMALLIRIREESSIHPCWNCITVSVYVNASENSRVESLATHYTLSRITETSFVATFAASLTVKSVSSEHT